MAKPATAQIRIGMSGWTFAPWRGVFYPKGLTQKRELEYASRMLNSIEINGTFYSLQRPETFKAWHDATPDDFLFSVKGGRFITHIRRLRDVDEPMARFMGSGILGLKEKLGPILWQLPPNFAYDAGRQEAFFRLLPRDMKSAAELANHHGPRDQVRAGMQPNLPMRHAMEVRHASFARPEFIDLLRKHNVALVIGDSGGKWPLGEDVTADFMYLRLHGDEELYASGYTAAALDRWAERIQLWRSGRQPADAVHWSDRKPAKAASRDLFVYFDNTVKVKSPFDAMSLAYRIGPTARGVDHLQLGAVPPEPKLTKKALAARVGDHR